jgi:hypothetical protein
MDLWDRKAERSETEAADWFKAAVAGDGTHAGLSLRYLDEMVEKTSRAELKEPPNEIPLHLIGEPLRLGSTAGRASARTADELSARYAERLKLRGHVQCDRCQKYLVEIAPDGSLVFDKYSLTFWESYEADAVACPRCSRGKKVCWAAFEDAVLYGVRVRAA